MTIVVAPVVTMMQTAATGDFILTKGPTRSVGVHATLPLGLAALLLLGETGFLGAPRGLGGLAALPHRHRSADQLHQSELGRLAVLELAPARARDDADPPVAVDARRQLRGDAL